MTSCNCQENFFLSSSECMACPSGSARALPDDQSVCTCDTGRATLLNAVNTTRDECNGMLHALVGTCMSGPRKGGYSYVPGGCLCMLTIIFLFDPGCANGYFNNATGVDSVLCVLCPSNSESSRPTDTMCTCTEGTVLLNSSDLMTNYEPCSGKYTSIICLVASMCLLLLSRLSCRIL